MISLQFSLVSFYPRFLQPIFVSRGVSRNRVHTDLYARIANLCARVTQFQLKPTRAVQYHASRIGFYHVTREAFNYALDLAA